MKIAMVFDGLGVGGIERVGADYIKMMHGLGYEIDVYNLNPKYNALEEEIGKRANIINYPLNPKVCPEIYSYGVKKWWWGKYAYPLLYTFFKGYLKIKKIRFLNNQKEYDVAIAFAGHINDLTFVSEKFIKSSKKMCWLHGSLAEYLMICSGFARLYTKIKNLCVLSNYAQEISLSGNKYLRNLNIKKIYNPTFIGEKELDLEICLDLTNRYGEFLLMVGRFTLQKDQGTVVKALKILKDDYDINKNLIFVGDGEERRNIEHLAKELDVADQVIFAGTRHDVENYYNSAHICIHSSPTEGFGLIILEAMSYGVPIVTTNSTPGIPEIIKNDEYGLTSPVGDEIAMASNIKRLLEDRELYDEFKYKGLKRINDFLPENIAPQLKIIINELID